MHIIKNNFTDGSKRRVIGFFSGLFLFLFILFLPVPQQFINNAIKILPPEISSSNFLEFANSSKLVLALLGLMVIWWVTEPIPIPVTAFLPAIILPVFHVIGFSEGKIFFFNVKNVLVNYAHPVIYLFFGGFVFAAAIQKWNLDKRFTLFILTRGKIAQNPKLIILGMMSVSAFISMWMSNTATTAMLLPIGLGIIAQAGLSKTENNFGKALMLGIAWGASIGGVGTIIGTPPNGICVSILNNAKVASISFFDWMKFGVPYVLCVIPLAWFILIKVFPLEINKIELGNEMLLIEKKKLGKLTKPEKQLLILFVFVVILWITGSFWKYIFPSEIFSRLEWIDENVIALLGAILIFTVPVDLKKNEFLLTWKDTKFVDWGTLILFGGGIALSDAMFKTGMAEWIASISVYFAGSSSTLVLVIIVVFMMDFLTEVTSNTAVTSMMIPIIISIANGAGANPVAVSIAASVGASMAFMMPVATPPNALVYGTGKIKITDMIKAGFILDLIGWIATIIIIYLFAYEIFGIISF